MTTVPHQSYEIDAQRATGLVQALWRIAGQREGNDLLGLCGYLTHDTDARYGLRKLLLDALVAISDWLGHPPGATGRIDDLAGDTVYWWYTNGYDRWHSTAASSPAKTALSKCVQS